MKNLNDKNLRMRCLEITSKDTNLIFNIDTLLSKTNKLWNFVENSNVIEEYIGDTELSPKIDSLPVEPINESKPINDNWMAQNEDTDITDVAIDQIQAVSKLNGSIVGGEESLKIKIDYLYLMLSKKFNINPYEIKKEVDKIFKHDLSKYNPLLPSDIGGTASSCQALADIYSEQFNIPKQFVTENKLKKTKKKIKNEKINIQNTKRGNTRKTKNRI